MSIYDIYGIGAALVDTEIEVTDLDLADLEIDKGVMTLVDEERQRELISALSTHLVASKRLSPQVILAPEIFIAVVLPVTITANFISMIYPLQGLITITGMAPAKGLPVNA